jgi:hypothetical protein
MSHEGLTYWAVESSLDVAPTLDRLNQMTDQCVSVAYSLDVEYDGWYTETVSPE